MKIWCKDKNALCCEMLNRKTVFILKDSSYDFLLKSNRANGKYDSSVSPFSGLQRTDFIIFSEQFMKAYGTM